jgi:antitoxin CptB
LQATEHAGLAVEGADSGPLDGYIKPRPATSGLSAFRCQGMPMTGTTRSSEGLDDRRKRLLFRCWHRGTREMDLILGRFADAEIGALSDGELSELERLLEIPDPDFYAAVTGSRPLPPDAPGSLFARIKAFRATDVD